MARRVQRADLLRGGDMHRDAGLLQRTRGELFRAQRIHVAHQPGVGSQHLAVLNLDAFLAPGGNGIDPRPERASIDVLEQSGVSPFANDLLVDAPGLVTVKHLRLEGTPVDPHGKARDSRSLGKGKEVLPLHLVGALVEKHLVNVGRGHLVINLDCHAVVLDGQRAQRHRRTRRLRRDDGNDHAIGAGWHRLAQPEHEQQQHHDRGS